MSTLIVPELGRNRGTGHLKRCLWLLRVLPDSFVYVPGHLSARFEEFGAEVDQTRIVSLLGESRFERVVVDRFSISEEEMRSLQECGTTIGLDLGGPGRPLADYLIDMLPRLDEGLANRYSPSFLLSHIYEHAASGEASAGPEDTAEADRGGGILVSFGGEDPAGLTEQTVRALRDCGIDLNRVRVMRPKLRRLDDGFGRLPLVTEPVESLWPLLAESDWVVTSFGLTAYEAAAQGCRVITVAPTRYHEKLAFKAGFYSAGVGKVSRRRLKRALQRTEELDLRTAALRQAAGANLAEAIKTLSQPAHRGCPVHRAFGAAVFRSEEKSYFACPTCGMVYLERFRADSEQYGSSYFMDEYRAQYGRTYLEDFASIQRMGAERLRIITHLQPPGKRLLDVGCAYGPFLAAAAERGFQAAGIDVAEEPVRYVREQLGFRAVSGSILDAGVRSALPWRQYDVVSLWFVIEHFFALDELLATLAELVTPGGILALSTPHGEGVSARRNSARFLEESPRDHYTVWTRASATNVLREFGFALESVRVTGHHPERYPCVKAGLVPKRLGMVHSRVFGWGDTFELYARRTG